MRSVFTVHFTVHIMTYHFSSGNETNINLSQTHDWHCIWHD